MGAGVFDLMEVALADGRAVVLRTALPADAGAIVRYTRELSATTDQIVTQPDEVLTEARMRKRLSEMARGGASLWLLADHDGTIVGDCALRAGERRKLAHVALMGMGVADGWRGAGLGRAMLAAALEWARAHPALLRVELGVLATNPPAIALYESLGFEREGVERWRIRQPDGTLVDEIRMGVWVGPAPSPGQPPGQRGR